MMTAVALPVALSVAADAAMLVNSGAVVSVPGGPDGDPGEFIGPDQFPILCIQV